VLKRIFLPLLIGLLAIAQVVTGLVGASGIRADQRHDRAVAAEKRAVAAYRAKVQPLVVQVFDVVQPLQDASDAFDTPRPGLESARDDVLEHTGAVAALSDVTTKLKAQKAPKTLAAAGTKLASNLADLRTAAIKLAAATHAKGDAHGFVAAYGDAFDLLYSAETGWTLAVRDTFGEKATSALPLPSAARTGAAGRKTPTKGSYIHASDLACEKAMDDYDNLPTLSAEQSIKLNAPREAAIIRRLLASLGAVPGPPADGAFVHSVRVQAKGNLAVATALEQLSSALKRLDQTAYQAAFKRYVAAFASARALSRLYKKYGVNSCAQFFDVDQAVKSGSGTAKA
jgi:hypothetical protein